MIVGHVYANDAGIGVPPITAALSLIGDTLSDTGAPPSAERFSFTYGADEYVVTREPITQELG